MWNVEMSGCASCLRSLYSNSDSSLVWSVDPSRDSPTTLAIVSVKHNLLNVSTVVASYVNASYSCVIVYVLSYSLIGMLIEFQWIWVNTIAHLNIWIYVFCSYVWKRYCLCILYVTFYSWCLVTVRTLIRVYEETWMTLVLNTMQSHLCSPSVFPSAHLVFLALVCVWSDHSFLMGWGRGGVVDECHEFLPFDQLKDSLLRFYRLLIV